MALENVIAYAFALGLPLWLVIEEIRHRMAPRHEAQEAPLNTGPRRLASVATSRIVGPRGA